jgi:hypothetical protein
MRREHRAWCGLGAAIVVVTAIIWWGRMQRTGDVPNSETTELPSGVTWSKEFDAVSSLAAVSSRIVASLVIATKPYLAGIDAEGRMTWRNEVPGPGLLIGAGRSVFAAFADRIMIIDPADGSVGARRDADPPPGGWTQATILSTGEDLLIADAHGLERLRAGGLETLWMVTPALDEENDSIQQLAYEPPWIAVVSNHTVMVVSERGELHWTRQLPADTRLAGDRPLVLADHRIWVGLVKESNPRVRYLYEVSASDGKLESETSIDDLAMFCPAHVLGSLLVLDTLHGLAGFDIVSGLKRRWSIDAPVATGACLRQNGDLLVATRNGELLRVALADGRTETLMRLPRKQIWVPPAPDLSPGVHSESAMAIEHLVALPGGIAFSASGSKDRAVIQFHPW